MTQKCYDASIDGGNGGDTDIEADNLKEAWEYAVAWAKEGDWPDDGCLIQLNVSRQDDDGEILEEEWDFVEIVPDEDALDEYSDDHKRDDHEHDWRAPHSIVGGIRENPGCWSHGGLRLTFESVCRCGARRHEDYDPQRYQQHQGLERITRIDYPDGLFPWGEDCEYPGKRNEN